MRGEKAFKMGGPKTNDGRLAAKAEMHGECRLRYLAIMLVSGNDEWSRTTLPLIPLGPGDMPRNRIVTLK